MAYSSTRIARRAGSTQALCVKTFTPLFRPRQHAAKTDQATPGAQNGERNARKAWTVGRRSAVSERSRTGEKPAENPPSQFAAMMREEAEKKGSAFGGRGSEATRRGGDKARGRQGESATRREREGATRRGRDRDAQQDRNTAHVGQPGRCVIMRNGTCPGHVRYA